MGTRTAKAFKKVLDDVNTFGAQMGERTFLLKWSRRGRFRTACELVRYFTGMEICDYGCGDGTFLAMTNGLFSRAVGIDIDLRQIQGTRERFGTLKATEFYESKEFFNADNAGHFRLVTCMDVFDGCSEEVQSQILTDLHFILNRDGTLIVSVPIEIGPPVIVKQIIRRLAARAGHGEEIGYQEYGLLELLKNLFATRNSKLSRQGRKGFNWREFKRKLEQKFLIRRTYYTPFRSLGGTCNGHVFFICEKKTGLQSVRPV